MEGVDSDRVEKRADQAQVGTGLAALQILTSFPGLIRMHSPCTDPCTPAIELLQVYQ